MLRKSLVLVHRWVGIGLAVFLVPAALTGSLLVWQQELDLWLNPALHRVDWAGATALSESQLAAKLRDAHPGVRIIGMEPPPEPGRSALLVVYDWPSSAGSKRRVNEVFVNPTSGAVLGTRSSIAPRLNRAEFMHWIRRFHYTLMLKRNGMLFMGWVAVVWVIDCFGGALLTLPRTLARWRKWRIAWQVKPARLNFDLHRAGGLWLWPVLFVLTVSTVYLILTNEVFIPALEWLAWKLVPEAHELAVIGAILEWQYPLHTGEAFGLTGRIIVCAAGVAIAVIAVTGIRITLRKLRGRAPQA